MEGLSAYQKDERPWGGFERFTLNQSTTVKLLTVTHGEAFSLQKHTGRDEFWCIISGNGIITVGNEEHPAQVGGRFFIPRGTQHRAAAASENLVILEISFGDFEEQDIIRLDDRYGRH